MKTVSAVLVVVASLFVWLIGPAFVSGSPSTAARAAAEATPEPVPAPTGPSSTPHEPAKPATTEPAPEDRPASPVPESGVPSPLPNEESAAPAPPSAAPLPPSFPTVDPASTQSSVPWASIGIAAGAIVVSLVVLLLIVRRWPPRTRLPVARSQARPAGAAADVLNAMAEVGEAMVDSGYPVTVVRSSLDDLASANLRPTAEVVVFPTALMISVNDDDGRALTQAVSTGHHSYLLHQVDHVDRVVTASRARPETARWAQRQLARIDLLPPPFTRVQRVVGYIAVSASISVLLGASWTGVAVAAVLGAVVGALLLVSEGVPSNYQVLVTVGAAYAVSLTVFLIVRTSLDPGVLPSVVAPLVILLPGGLLTTGVIELATGHYLSGAARLAAGGMRLILLAVGIVAAAELIGIPAIDLTGARDPLGPIAPWLAVAVFGIGIAVHQCARPRSIGWIILVLYIAYGAQVLGDALFGGVLSALIGALAMTPVAVIIARQRSGPPAIVSFLPAFWLLVPGALGLVGVTAILDGDTNGVGTLTTTVATMVAIALGVVIGLAFTRGLRSAGPPRR